MMNPARFLRILGGLGASVLLLALGGAAAVFAQDGPAGEGEAPPPRAAPATGGTPGGPATPPRGIERERMWPAPTAEDWAKPCLIVWQRTWEDALAVAKETQRAILICINMDGEIASEHWAGVRYRLPEVAKLYEPYVCVIASTYRHTPRDYDDAGNRIVCPRFGTVTCGEHIRIEPILYEQFFDEQRIAPRHIMVELDGSETYDIFYRNDVRSIEVDIEKAIAERKIEPRNIVRGDRPVVERVDSRDVVDRMAVEKAWQEGDADLRRRLLAAAAENESDVPVELLRLGVFSLDVELARNAREVLAKTKNAAAADLVADALRTPVDEKEREALIGALERLGAESPRAHWLAALHRGLGARSTTVDPNAWAKARAAYEESAARTELQDAETRFAELRRAHLESPEDPAIAADLADAAFDAAMRANRVRSGDPRTDMALSRHWLSTARRTAADALELGAPAERVQANLALSAYYSGDREGAYAEAEKAVKLLTPGDPSWKAMATLTVFAEGRWMGLKAAVREKRRWPPHWLSDLDAAYSALAQHPKSVDSQVEWHQDFLLWLGANDRARKVIEAGIERFPASALLHQRLRERMLADRGPADLLAKYDELLAKPDPHPDLEWYAGYAALVVAEGHRRQLRPAEAFAAYDRAAKHFERAAAANPANEWSAMRYLSLVHAGRARLAFERNDHAAALESILASFTTDPTAAGTVDNMGFTPASTAQALHARLVADEKTAEAERLTAAMAELDPELLKPIGE